MNPLISDQQINKQGSELHPAVSANYYYREGAKWSRDLCTAEHERRMAAVRAEADAAIVHYQGSDKALEELRESWADLRQQVEAVTKQLDERCSDIICLEHSNDSLRQQVEALTTKLDDMTKARDIYRDKMFEHSRKCQDAATQVEALGKELDMQIKAKEIIFYDGSDQIEKLKVQLTEAKSEHNRSLKIRSANDDQLNAEIEGLKGELAEAKNLADVRGKIGSKYLNQWNEARAEVATLRAASVPREVVEVMDEVERATRKFPTWPTDPIHAAMVVQEESGELAKAVLESVYEPTKSTPDNVRKEAVQTAAMAIRFLMSFPKYVLEKCPQHSQQALSTQPAKEATGEPQQATPEGVELPRITKPGAPYFVTLETEEYHYAWDEPTARRLLSELARAVGLPSDAEIWLESSQFPNGDQAAGYRYGAIAMRDRITAAPPSEA